MKKVVLIGDPINHSLSPLLHKKWIKDFGLEARYEARQTKAEDIPEMVRALREGSLAGINATIPHKKTLLDLADEQNPAARKIGAANTLYIRAGKICAGNTDPEGFIENLKYQAPEWRSGGKALILGNGAAARAAVYSLFQAGQKDIVICGRDSGKSGAINKDFPGIQSLPWPEKEKISSEISLLVNATPLGLPGFGEVDFDLAALRQGALVYDLVYGREKTSFLQKAEKRGLKTIDGLGMLVFQAIPAFEAWFVKRPQFDKNLLDFLRRKG